MGLREIESSLPPGFRFYPSDEELVCHYLYRKVANQRVSEGGTMVEVDLHTREPWELPEVARLNANEWYFFSFRDRKYATGSRTNRATKAGYWKATGKDRVVHDPSTQSIIGMRKTLVFYRGRAPNGLKTGWVMHEFRLENPHNPPMEDWVLCRVFNKNRSSDHHHSLSFFSHENPNTNIIKTNIDQQEEMNCVELLAPPSPAQVIDDFWPIPADHDRRHHGLFELDHPGDHHQEQKNEKCNTSNYGFINLAALHQYSFFDDFPQEMEIVGAAESSSTRVLRDECNRLLFGDATGISNKV